MCHIIHWGRAPGDAAEIQDMCDRLATRGLRATTLHHRPGATEWENIRDMDYCILVMDALDGASDMAWYRLMRMRAADSLAWTERTAVCMHRDQGKETPFWERPRYRARVFASWRAAVDALHVPRTLPPQEPRIRHVPIGAYTTSAPLQATAAAPAWNTQSTDKTTNGNATYRGTEEDSLRDQPRRFMVHEVAAYNGPDIFMLLQRKLPPATPGMDYDFLIQRKPAPVAAGTDDDDTDDYADMPPLIDAVTAVSPDAGRAARRLLKSSRAMPAPVRAGVAAALVASYPDAVWAGMPMHTAVLGETLKVQSADGLEQWEGLALDAVPMPLQTSARILCVVEPPGHAAKPVLLAARLADAAETGRVAGAVERHWDMIELELVRRLRAAAETHGPGNRTLSVSLGTLAGWHPPWFGLSVDTRRAFYAALPARLERFAADTGLALTPLSPAKPDTAPADQAVTLSW